MCVGASGEGVHHAHCAKTKVRSGSGGVAGAPSNHRRPRRNSMKVIFAI